LQLCDDLRLLGREIKREGYDLFSLLATASQELLNAEIEAEVETLVLAAPNRSLHV